MTHYVVLCVWAADKTYDRGVEIKAVAHTLEEAKGIFAEEVAYEKQFAEENGYDVLIDTDTEFDAGHFGYYNQEHAHLYIEEVK